MGLKEYVVLRAIQSFALVLIIVSMAFVIFRLLPGSPVLLVGNQQLTPAETQQLMITFGLDKPVWQQYLLYVQNIFQGNMGLSFVTGQPVINEILARLPNTIILMGLGTLLAIVFGIVLGLIAARHEGGKADTYTLASSLFLYSVPAFWLGLVFLVLFAVQIPIFPLGGTISRPPPEGLVSQLSDRLFHLVLPVLTLALNALGGYILLMRSTVIEELHEDYVITARAKGLSEREILFNHVLRNSSLPMITTIAISLANLFTGAVTIETVFSWNGVGQYIVQSVYSLDYPVLQGIFLIVGVYVVLANFLTDLLYVVVDPRVKLTME